MISAVKYFGKYGHYLEDGILSFARVGQPHKNLNSTQLSINQLMIICRQATPI
jgi:hypothetical protein